MQSTSSPPSRKYLKIVHTSVPSLEIGHQTLRVGLETRWYYVMELPFSLEELDNRSVVLTNLEPGLA
jgi:hypothetical protein